MLVEDHLLLIVLLISDYIVYYFRVDKISFYKFFPKKYLIFLFSDYFLHQQGMCQPKTTGVYVHFFFLHHRDTISLFLRP